MITEDRTRTKSHIEAWTGKQSTTFLEGSHACDDKDKRTLDSRCLGENFNTSG